VNARLLYTAARQDWLKTVRLKSGKIQVSGREKGGCVSVKGGSTERNKNAEGSLCLDLSEDVHSSAW